MASSPQSSDSALRETQARAGQQERWLEGIVKTVLILNLFDAVFTLLWVRMGLAEEANTLLDELVNDHPVAFVLVKLGLVGMGSWLLWYRRKSPLAVIAIFAVFLVYYAILLVHVQYASQLIGSVIG